MQVSFFIKCSIQCVDEIITKSIQAPSTLLLGRRIYIMQSAVGFRSFHSIQTLVALLR